MENLSNNTLKLIDRRVEVLILLFLERSDVLYMPVKALSQFKTCQISHCLPPYLLWEILAIQQVLLSCSFS